MDRCGIVQIVLALGKDAVLNELLRQGLLTIFQFDRQRNIRYSHDISTPKCIKIRSFLD